ncbi:LOW QUALITY PROTEIN: hypothetical protein PHMEG_0009071 [Phytophthora megakarya]|uniref:Transposase n=1 Tax=Phytophthora megakarya TaxID=4795 RepID=A0A225WJ46_9STRA|nr:LOW QUALITY PROTEIN: hypothetical protein PHMEG_0009071 [Phytophthora megakarya]
MVLLKDKQLFYLGEQEEDAHITLKKNYIVKPRCVWDGKIGLSPFAVYEPAQRSSKNRDAGTLELKSYTVDRDIYRRALCRMVIPRIKAIWPSGKRVALQHDNVKPHVAADDPKVMVACRENGWDMKICLQPANSPDFNAKGLGVFASLQSRQYKKNAKTIESTIVDAAFRHLEYIKIDRATMRVDGCNIYKIPHLSMDQLRTSNGLLPPSLVCNEDVYTNAIAYLSSVE